MNRRSPQTDDGDCSAADVLKHASHAMRATHEMVHDLELEVLQQLQTDAQSLSKPLDVQAIDLLSQSLKELELLIARVAAALPQNTMLRHDDVIAPIRLERLRDLIGAGPGHRHQSDSARAHDDISLF